MNDDEVNYLDRGKPIEIPTGRSNTVLKSYLQDDTSRYMTIEFDDNVDDDDEERGRTDIRQVVATNALVTRRLPPHLLAQTARKKRRATPRRPPELGSTAPNLDPSGIHRRRRRFVVGGEASLLRALGANGLRIGRRSFCRLPEGRSRRRLHRGTLDGS